MRRTITFLTAFIFMLTLFSIQINAQSIENLAGPNFRAGWGSGTVYGDQIEEGQGTSGAGSYVQLAPSTGSFTAWAATDDLKRIYYDYNFSQIYVKGSYYKNIPADAILGFNIVFYTDMTDYMSLMPQDTFLIYENHQNFVYDSETNDALIMFEDNVVLPSRGYYWMSVQAIIDKDHPDYNYWNWSWEYMVENTTIIDQKPYKKGSYTQSSGQELDDWKPQTKNLSYSLRTSYTTDVALAMVTPTTLINPDFTDAEELGIRVYNMGSTEATNVEVSYNLDGSVVTETIAGPIAPMSNIDHTFTTAMDLSAISTYELSVYVNIAGDENMINDTISTILEKIPPVYEMDDINGTVVEACFGNFYDAGGIDGNSGFRDNFSTTFKSATAGEMASLTFAYAELVKYGTQVVGTLTFYNGLDNTAAVLGVLESNIAENDEPYVVTAANADGAITVEFTSSNYSNWVAGLSCVAPNSLDVAAVEVLNPNYDDELTATESLIAKFANYGNQALTNVSVNYTLNNGDTVSETVASVAAFEVFEHTFTTATFDLTIGGSYNFNVWIELDGDVIPNNNNTTYGINVYNGGEYLMNADTVNNDTIITCEGVIADPGGIAGDAPAEGNSRFGGARYQTKIFAPDADHRIQLTFDQFDLGSGYNIGGGLVLTNDTVVNSDAQTAFGQYGIDPTGMKFLAMNAGGGFILDYTTPTVTGFPGFAAKIECVEILEKDFALNGFSIPDAMAIVGESNELNASVMNIGKTNSDVSIALVVNGVGIDTLTLSGVGVDSVAAVAFNWVPMEKGISTIEMNVVEGMGDADMNSVALEIEVFGVGSLATSFEDGIPIDWHSTEGRFNISPSSHRYHGVNYLYTNYIDTLHTSLFKIEEGDKLSFYSRTSSGQNQDLIVGWYNPDSAVYKYFNYKEENNLADTYTRYEVDLSAAAGEICELVFITTENGKTCNIDYMGGPTHYASENDLFVLSSIIPTLETVGEKSSASVTVLNNGANLADGDYTIDVYAGAEMVYSMEGSALVTAQKATVSLPYVLSSVFNDTVVIKLTLEGDVDESNNVSNAVQVNAVPYGTIITETGSGKYSSDRVAYTSANYSVGQMIFTEEMIGATGMLEGIAFQQANGTKQDSVYVKVWVGATDLETLSYWDTENAAHKDSLLVGDSLTLVYENYVNMNAGMVDWVIPFDAGYNYTGGNLAAVVYQMSESNVNRKFNTSIAPNVYTLVYQSSDTIDINCNDYSTVSRVGNPTNIASDAKFLFGAISSNLTAMVKDAAGAAIENVAVEVVLDGTTLYTGTTDATGALSVSDVAVSTYNVSFMIEGYEYIMIEDVAVTAGTTDMGDVVLAKLASVTGLAAVVDNAAKSAVATWDAYAAKAFASYNVYFNGEMVAEGITENTYSFTNLVDGMHTVGVTAIYDGGIAEMVSHDFHVVYAPMDFVVNLYATESNASGTWSFNGTSEDFYGFLVYQEGTLLDTVMIPYYEFSNILAGTNTFAVSAYYMNGGESAKTEYQITGVDVSGDEAFELSVYPNPANSQVTVEGAENSTIEIVNIAGTVVMVQENNAATTKLDVSNLTSGVYLIKVTNNEGSVVSKLTIE